MQKTASTGYIVNTCLLETYAKLGSVTFRETLRLVFYKANALNKAIMKTKMILMAALASAAVLSVNSARAGIGFGFSIGVPAPMVVAPVPVVATPAPVYYAGPVAPAPVVEVAPACPGVDFVWAPGYWAHRDAGFAWVRGGWRYQPHYHYDHAYDHNYYHR
jgi:hypothetical protein